MQREYIINYIFNRASQLRFDGSTLFRRNRQGAVAQAARPFRAGQHHAAHADGEIAPVVLAAKCPPRQRPAAHGVLHVITAAARDKDGAIQFQHPLDNFDDDVVRHPQMRQRVARQNVQAEFQHEHVGRKRVRERHGDGIKSRQERIVVSFRRQRDVDVEAVAGAFADFILKTAHGKSVLPLSCSEIVITSLRP